VLSFSRCIIAAPFVATFSAALESRCEKVKRCGGVKLRHARLERGVGRRRGRLCGAAQKREK